MYYEINVSLDGRHLFATHKRSLTDSKKANQLYTLFCSKFPAKDGYEISLIEWKCVGLEINRNDAAK